LEQIYEIGDFGGHARDTAFKALSETGDRPGEKE